MNAKVSYVKLTFLTILGHLQGVHRIYGRSYKALNQKIPMSAQKVYAF